MCFEVVLNPVVDTLKYFVYKGAAGDIRSGFLKSRKSSLELVYSLFNFSLYFFALSGSG